MTILEALKSTNIRVSYGDRWLYYCQGQWVVLERKPYKKGNKTLIETDNEELAIETLLKD